MITKNGAHNAILGPLSVQIALTVLDFDEGTFAWLEGLLDKAREQADLRDHARQA